MQSLCTKMPMIMQIPPQQMYLPMMQTWLINYDDANSNPYSSMQIPLVNVDLYFNDASVPLRRCKCKYLPHFANVSIWRCNYKIFVSWCKCPLQRYKFQFLSHDANAPYKDANVIFNLIMQIPYTKMQMWLPILWSKCPLKKCKCKFMLWCKCPLQRCKCPLQRCKCDLTKSFLFISKSKLFRAQTQIFLKLLLFFSFWWALNIQCSILAPRNILAYFDLRFLKVGWFWWGLNVQWSIISLKNILAHFNLRFLKVGDHY